MTTGLSEGVTDAVVVSQTPGRLRIRLRPTERRAAVLQHLQAGLLGRPGSVEARANPRTGSILVRSAPDARSPDQVLAALAEPGVVVRGSGDRHPLLRLAGTVTRLPRYLGLAVALLHESNLPPLRRVVLLAGRAYIASPIDLVPGIIPILGQLDDMAIFPLALQQAINGLPPRSRMAI